MGATITKSVVYDKLEMMLTRAAAADSGLSLTRTELLRALRLMQISRRIDDREVLMKRLNQIFFQISGAGHEAIQVAAGMATRPGHDWFYPYYRDRALALTLGISPRMMMLQAVGAAEDTQSGGRQMPSHWSSRELHIVSGSSCTGSQFVQAVGCAQAGRLLHPAGDEVTLVTSGEGATSEGEFWEALNGACLGKLPVLFLIQDNHYAISVPVEVQTPGGNLSRLLSGFGEHLRIFETDGTDFVQSFRTMTEAVAHCRAGHGPALVHAHCIRPYSHSLSDDERFYKTDAERAAEAERDPLLTFPRYLRTEGLLTDDELTALLDEVEREVQEAADYALAAPRPAKDSALQFLYSPVVDPTCTAFVRQPDLSGEPRTLVDAINLTLAEELAADPRVVIFGEDVADCSRPSVLPEVKGKGGVFKTTQGLQRRFGSERVFNTPIAEAGIVGRAIGLATRGMKPVAEIQFFDYIWPAMMQIRDEMAVLRWRSNNGFACPAVIRVPIGGYLTGGSIYHSQSGEVLFTHIPGLRVVFPSNALDAVGLLRTAIRCDDPVLFLEHKKLYREPYNRAPHPGPDFTVPFGKARVAREGERLTVITYGAVVEKALRAASETGESIEVIDLRSLAPYDWDAIAASVKKTNRVLIAHEDCLSWGYGAEIAARVADELFGHLDAPVKRVGALDTWVGYSPDLEDAILPQTEDLTRAMRQLLAY
jgi:2-oxoisovalerate dehydrogenase E1 component